LIILGLGILAIARAQDPATALLLPEPRQEYWEPEFYWGLWWIGWSVISIGAAMSVWCVARLIAFQRPADTGVDPPRPPVN